jgi:hypothetical protein
LRGNTCEILIVIQKIGIGKAVGKDGHEGGDPLGEGGGSGWEGEDWIM